MSAAQIAAIIVLGPRPLDQGEGTRLHRTFVENRNLGVVRALDAIIVIMLAFDRAD